MFNLEECNNGTWSQYFHENMGGLGLPTPDSIFTATVTTLTNLHFITSALEKGGPANPSVTKVFRDATKAGKSGLLLGVTSSGYIGAAAGSSVVATARYVECGKSLGEVMGLIGQLYPSPYARRFISRFLREHREVIESDHPRRPYFKMRLRRQSRGLS